MKKLLLLFGCFSYCFLLHAQDMDLIYYNTSNTPVFAGTNDNFKAIGVGKEGHIWAGTANQGLYKFDGTTWEKSTTFLTNHNIADIKSDRNGGIWIAQYGSNGAQATGGGILHFPDAVFPPATTLYSISAGLPTRNVRSLFINNSDPLGNQMINPVYRVWSAHMAHLQSGVSVTGAVARGLNVVTPVPFISITAGVDISNGTGSCQTIGGNSEEVWVFASANFGQSQLLRYNTSTSAFKGYYDYDDINSQLPANSHLPANFTAKAIYFDNNGRAWVGMQTGGVYVFENNTWYHVNFAGIFPTGAIVNNNAITGDSTGRVYIGTTEGLVLYQGGDIDKASSYKLYTGNDPGTPLNVQAIAIDVFSGSPYSVVLATSKGIARWKLDNPIEVYNIEHLNPSAIRHRFEYAKNEEGIMVAVDGTASTLFKVMWSNPGPYKLKINNNDNPLTPDNIKKYGEFIEIAQDNTSKSFMYYHPSDPEIPINKFSRKETLQIIDTTTNTVVHNESIEFVRPPLLLVHGLFSSGEEGFGNIYNNLVNEGLYKYNQINLANYPGDRGFNETFPKVLYAIDRTLDVAIKVDHISCGKIDAGGHSMGGLLLRLYLQHASYKNDINKLITFNTPHKGSAFSNLVLSSTTTGILLRSALNMSGYGDPNGGAMNDLRVNSDHIVNKLIGNAQSENKVPTHAIVTTTDIVSDINDVLSDLNLNAPLILRILPSPYDKYLNLAITIINKAKDAVVAVAANYINNAVFAGVPHDVVASKISQIGGLDPNHISEFTEQWHPSTSEPKPALLNRFKELLSISADDALFTKTGFTPGTPIPEPDNLNNRQMQTQAGTLEITNPAENSTHSAGSSITMDFSYTLVDTILFLMSDYTKSLYVARIDAPATSFSFDIPDEYFGKVKILVIGFNGSGFSAMDSITINVGTNALLEEISIDPEAIIVPKTGYEIITINGNFNDQAIRNLTGYNGLTYSFAQNKAAFEAPNKIIGLEEGLDTLTVSFQGKSAILPIEITSQSNWILLDNNMNPLPTKLGSLSARLRNSTVSLEWKAYEDLDVSIYEVQHSKDGARFVTVGNVSPAHVNSERTYYYNHTDYVTGNNFYRIKVTEFNGKVLYTNVASVRVNGHLSMKLAPNPVRHTMEIIVTGKKDDNVNIIITDVSGKNVYQQRYRINNGVNNISIPAYTLASGLYIVRMETDTEKISEKFIKTD